MLLMKDNNKKMGKLSMSGIKKDYKITDTGNILMDQCIKWIKMVWMFKYLIKFKTP